MKLIPLTQGQFAKVDDDMYEELNQYKWYARCHKPKNYYYAIRADKIIKGNKSAKHLRMHRVIMNCPEGMVVDHINHDTLDNQRHNLRVCTTAQNTYNRLPNRIGKSRYKGVVWVKNRNHWHVAISVNGTRISLRTFKCEHDAARSYNEASLKYHGEFGYINIID